ncbi:MAG TPA: hypothetical protein VGU03_10995 [Frateuria sp.]|uniref:hypothetical protein n=1 Tax=Frateuria sp. TaxID=2211372 RepID=UPI002DE9FC96|nr:hypothetical protein [Frateuria sp.]
MTSLADRVLSQRMPRQVLRARMGLFLAGPMPTIAELRRRFQLGLSAGCYWHALIARARREFAA